MRHIGSAEAECDSVESGCRESADVHSRAMRRVGPAAVYGLANPVHPDQRRVMDTLSTLRRRITTGRAVPTASLFAAAVLVVGGCGLTGNRDNTEPGPAGASPNSRAVDRGSVARDGAHRYQELDDLHVG